MTNIALHDDQQPTDERDQPLSRSAYRQQQRQEQVDFDKRDKQRLRAEKRYAKQHSEPTYDEATQTSLTEAKIARLKYRLNWTIFGLSAGIIIVFFDFIFFVEF